MIQNSEVPFYDSFRLKFSLELPIFIFKHEVTILWEHSQLQLLIDL